MRSLTIVGLMSLVVLATFATPQFAVPLSARENALVRGGGCFAQNFANCANAVNTTTDACAECLQQIKCDSSGIDQACSTIYDRSPEDCISCGTCDNGCGGNELEYSGANCTGTFRTSECTRTWVDAQNGGCNVPCGPKT